MDIEAIVSIHIDRFLNSTGTTFNQSMTEALTEQAETHAIEMRAYEATVQNQAARIRQLEAERVPDGWKLVPIEPTRAMVDSVLRYANGDDLEFYGAHVMRQEIVKDWGLMLAAAPAKEGE